MSKKNEYYGLIYHILYDPIKELYYAGVPGYITPTIYVGKTEADVQNSVEDLLVDYLEHITESGYCHEKEIDYSAQEAYCTGWIIKELGVKVSEQGYQDQERRVTHQRLGNFIEGANRDSETNRKTINLHGQMDSLQEKIADCNSNLQFLRNELISQVKETGKPIVNMGDSKIMKVNRLGVLQEDLSKP